MKYVGVLLLLAGLLGACREPVTEPRVVDEDAPWRPPSQLFTTANSPLPSNSVNRVLVDAENRVWAGTYGRAHLSSDAARGLARFDGRTWQVYTARNSPLPDGGITDLALGPDSSVWVAAGGAQVYRFKNERWEVLEGPTDARIIHLTADNRGTLWAGSWLDTTGPVLYAYEGGTWRTEPGLSLPRQEQMQDLLVDRQNRLWVGTRSQGLYRRDAQGWINFRPDNSDQPLVGVGAMHEDARGGLWLVRNWSVDHSSATGPVVRYDGQRWTTVQVTRNSGYFQPLALTTDAAGKAWIGEANGFLRYDGTWLEVAIPELRITYQLATDRSGYVWAGTNQGLVRMQAW